MPGLVGFTTGGDDCDRSILQDMREMMRHQSHYVDDDIYFDDHVCATRISKHIVQKDAQPYHSDDLLVWLKGEFCNQADLASLLGKEYAKASDPALLAALYRRNDDPSILAKIDGIYSAVVYDVRRQSLHLITDRYGFGYLYWTIIDGSLCWASEAKAFLAHPRFEPRIDEKTVQDFFETGYPLDNETWFEGVELVPPGTVLSWDLHDGRLDTETYWSWTDISRIDGRVGFSEMVEELGRLWTDAVERRSYLGDQKIGISLSGGLDSRAIIAAMPDLGYPLHAVTIGHERTDDVRIARRVARLKGAFHHRYDLNAENWLRLRAQAVWWSDGQFDIKHMHGCVLIDKVGRYYDVNMSGIVGGPILGGSFLTRYKTDREEEARYMASRGRRYFPAHVLSIDDIFLHYRLPFMDNALVDFIFSVPDDARAEYRIYKSMLLNRFSAYYAKIPWQDTGLPIAASEFRKRVKALEERIADLQKRVAKKLNPQALQSGRNNGRQFHDYESWLRMEPSKQIFSDLLTSNSALYSNYIDREPVIQAWNDQLEGRNRARKLCRYATFETWLQQVFEGKYRHGWGRYQPRALSESSPA